MKGEQACNPSFQGNKHKTARSTVSIGHKKWTDAECRKLRKAYTRHGENWDAIARCVSGRNKEECMEEIKDIWVVQKFVGHRPSSEENGGWELKTRWARWSEEDDTWEPIVEKYEEDPHLVEQYTKLNPGVFVSKSLKRKRETEQYEQKSSNKISRCVNKAEEGMLHKIKAELTSEDSKGCKALANIICQDTEYARWTDIELRVLVSLRDSGERWEQISEAVTKVGYGRSAKACQKKFLDLSNNDKFLIQSGRSIDNSFNFNFEAQTWTDEELKVLVLLKDKEEDWRVISEAASKVRCKRSIISCRTKFYRLDEKEKERIRCHCVQSNRMVSWTRRELKALVLSANSENSWQKVSEAVGKVGLGRSAVECRKMFCHLGEHEKVQLWDQGQTSTVSCSPVMKQSKKAFPSFHDVFLHLLKSFFGLFFSRR